MSHEQHKFQAPAILNSFSYTKDGGARLGFVTNELSDSDKLIITGYFGKFGFVLFQSSEFGDDDVPKETPRRDSDSWSPSRKLRHAIFREWRVKGKGDFEDYYEQRVTQLIKYMEED